MNPAGPISRVTISIACGALMASSASAQWSADPAAPLVIGHTEGLFGPRLSLVTADDDAVWVAWQDKFCGGFESDGSVRLQRIAPDGSLLAASGIEVQDDETCGFVVPPVLSAVGNSAVVSRWMSGVVDHAVERLGADGSPDWTPGFTGPAPLALAGAARLVNDDVLIVSIGFGTIHSDRIDAAGGAVWPEQSVFSSPSGANFRIFAIIPDPTGGAFIFWDSPLSYTRLIYAMRIGSDGKPAWESTVRLVEPPPGIASSRHTDPVAVADGQGGAVIVWTHGFETGTTPAPLRVQRIDADGDLAFPIEGVRVSLGADRQFDADVSTDDTTGDLLIAWRDGLTGPLGVRAQRLSLAGERLWGDEGVEMAPLAAVASSFDAIWLNDRFSVAIAEGGGVDLHSVDTQGNSTPGPWSIGTGADAYSVRVTPSDDAIIVAWQSDQPGQDDLVVAQRVNPDGRLGVGACNAADIAAPFGSLDFSDVVAFLTAFGAMESEADLAEPLGAWDFSDVVAFLGLFGGGCP